MHPSRRFARPSRSALLLKWWLARAYSSAASAGDSLAAVVSLQAATQLGRHGWAVVDGALCADTCRALVAEIQDLRTRNLLTLNSTHLVRGGERQLLEKTSIHEGDLLREEVFAAAPHFARLQSDTGLRTMLSLFLPSLRLDTQATKLQWNSGGGGCFPTHFDSDESVDSRRVTAITYLNADWKPEHGGQLRLYPGLGPPVDFEPLAGRLLLFSTCRMPHRVLPSLAERFCFTVWLSDTRGRSSPPMPLQQVLQAAEAAGSREGGPRAQAAQRAFLRQPEARKCLARLAHAREWLESLQQSHPASPARAAAIANLEAELAFLRGQLESTFPGVGLQEWAEADKEQAPAWF